MYVCILAALGLCCCTRAFSSYGELGSIFLAGHGLLTVAVSLITEHWFEGAQASVVVAHRLSCPVACGICVPCLKIEPCSLLWKVDSQPLDQQGNLESLRKPFKKKENLFPPKTNESRHSRHSSWTQIDLKASLVSLMSLVYSQD